MQVPDPVVSSAGGSSLGGPVLGGTRPPVGRPPALPLTRSCRYPLRGDVGAW